MTEYQPGGGLPVGPSANRVTAQEVLISTGTAPYPDARALEKHDIKRIVEEYAQAARNAVEAGGATYAENPWSGSPASWQCACDSNRFAEIYSRAHCCRPKLAQPYLPPAFQIIAVSQGTRLSSSILMRVRGCA